GADEDSYWRQVLHYCRSGNLPALLDEYVHCVKEASGASSNNLEDATLVARQMYDAMTLRTVLTHPEEIRVAGDTACVRPLHPPRWSHVAARVDSRSDAEKSGDRYQAVKAAFNSPFTPLAPASPSVGQEGLDLHTWCHAVIHWNLRSSPVDLEQ